MFNASLVKVFVSHDAVGMAQKVTNRGKLPPKSSH